MLILWEGSNKAVTVMYVAHMRLGAVVPVAAHLYPLEETNWGRPYIRSYSGELPSVSHSQLNASLYTFYHMDMDNIFEAC